MANLGLLIKSLREKNNWVQTELAKKSGVSKTAIGDIETGVKTSLSREQKEGLASAFGISLEEFNQLLGGEKHI